MYTQNKSPKQKPTHKHTKQIPQTRVNSQKHKTDPPNKNQNINAQNRSPKQKPTHKHTKQIRQTIAKT